MSEQYNGSTEDSSDSQKRESEDEKEYVYRDEALYLTEDTTVQEIVDYLQAVIENPIFLGEDNQNVVWNFSTHEFKRMASEDEVVGKDCDRFIVPYQVTGGWAFMFTLLPEAIKEAEVLVYKPNEGEYFAYRNFYRTTSSGRHSQIQQDLARRLEKTAFEGARE